MISVEEFRKSYEKNVRASEFKPLDLGSERKVGGIVSANVAVAWSENEEGMSRTREDPVKYPQMGFGETIILSDFLTSDLKNQAIKDAAEYIFNRLVEVHGTSIVLSHNISNLQKTIYGDTNELA